MALEVTLVILALFDCLYMSALFDGGETTPGWEFQEPDYLTSFLYYKHKVIFAQPISWCHCENHMA